MIFRIRINGTIKTGLIFRIVVFILSGAEALVSAQPARPTPQAIIREMIERYASALSYQDSGVVRVVRDDPPIAMSLDSPGFRMVSYEDDVWVSFKISFARPRRFRFDWKGHMIPGSREAVIWCDGKKAYSWMPNRFEQDKTFTLSSTGSLQFLIDEARGSSSGAVFFVTSMLIKDASYSSFADMLTMMSEMSLRKDEQVEGHDCFVIKGRMSGIPWTLWIDKDQLLLRKTRTTYSRGGSFHDKTRLRERFVGEEIHSNIQINEMVPRNRFRYKPQLLRGDFDLTR